MSALTILIVIALILVWFLISPFFTKIGEFVNKSFKNALTEEDEKEKETKEE